MKKKDLEKTPFEEMIEKKWKEYTTQKIVDHELRKYGTEIPGGYILTASQMKKYFEDVEQRQRKRNRRDRKNV